MLNDIPPLIALVSTFLVSDTPDAGALAAAALAGLVQVDAYSVLKKDLQ